MRHTTDLQLGQLLVGRVDVGDGPLACPLGRQYQHWARRKDNASQQRSGSGHFSFGNSLGASPGRVCHQVSISTERAQRYIRS
jgi:hypothetical protein